MRARAGVGRLTDRGSYRWANLTLALRPPPSTLQPPPSTPGSVLDQEIAQLTLIEAAVRSPTASNASSPLDHGLLIARHLLAERTALRTTSAQSWLRYAAVLERLGDDGQVEGF